MTPQAIAATKQLLSRLWDDYLAITPLAARIHALLQARGEIVRNDHIAFRTFGVPAVGMDVLSRPFVNGGYEARGAYEFPEKKLVARHYEHPEPAMPKVFISELQVARCSPGLQRVVAELVAAIPCASLESPELAASGRPWPLTLPTYRALLAESEYAAWTAAFGFRANHFTVDVGELRTFSGLEELNALLVERGFVLNTSGGVIKGSPAELLEQSSTLADEIEVAFADQKARIPSCYYEFARRYRLPDGKLFQGFIAGSADKIFESTDARRPAG